MKFNIQTFAITVLLLVSLLLRIHRFEIPGILTSKWGDATRDYLVAHYIKNDGERPLLGPFNLLYEVGLRNSPLYYYLLAAFLIPYDSMETLGVINIFFQVAAIALIYLITKAIFDQRSALIAALIFGFTPTVLAQSEYIWQPNLMQPLAYLSLYSLSLSYLKKSYYTLLLSLVMVNMAAVLHNSIFSWWPLFLLLTFFILKSQHKNIKFYLGVILTFLTSLILLYLPVLIYFVQNGFQTTTSPVYLQSVANYFQNLEFNFSQIMQTFSTDRFWVIIFILLLISYLSLETKKRRFLVVTFLFFLAPVATSSLFNKNQLLYLTVSLGLFAILLAVSVNRIFKNTIILILVVAFLFKTTSADFKFLHPQREGSADNRLINLSADVIRQQVEDAYSFQVISYASRETIFRYPTLDTLILVPLEKKLNVKLAKISDDSPFTLVQINDDRLIFVTCFEFNHPNAVMDCSRDFSGNFPNFTLVKNIYNRYPISIYLFLKK